MVVVVAHSVVVLNVWETASLATTRGELSSILIKQRPQIEHQRDTHSGVPLPLEEPCMETLIKIRKSHRTPDKNRSRKTSYARENNRSKAEDGSSRRSLARFLAFSLCCPKLKKPWSRKQVLRDHPVSHLNATILPGHREGVHLLIICSCPPCLSVARRPKTRTESTHRTFTTSLPIFASSMVQKSVSSAASM